jgi:hypothetical protein
MVDRYISLYYEFDDEEEEQLNFNILLGAALDPLIGGLMYVRRFPLQYDFACVSNIFKAKLESLAPYAIVTVDDDVIAVEVQTDIDRNADYPLFRYQEVMTEGSAFPEYFDYKIILILDESINSCVDSFQ